MSFRSKTFKFDIDAKKAKAAIEMMKQHAQPFSVSMTNYTITIRGEAITYKFMKQERSISFFAKYKKLKAEVETYLKTHEIAEIKRVDYYDIQLSPDFKESEVFNIDLSAAYLHVLKNEKIISIELFNELNALEKQDRLSIVGMLAARKSVFYFNENGEIIKHEIIEDKQLRNVFFHCVNVTHFIMLKCREFLEDDYIFSWVDGVYFHNESNCFIIGELLKEINYPYTIERLENFSYTRKKDNIVIEFDKGIKTKHFEIPLIRDKFASDIYNYLQQQIK